MVSCDSLDEVPGLLPEEGVTFIFSFRFYLLILLCLTIIYSNYSKTEKSHWLLSIPITSFASFFFFFFCIISFVSTFFASYNFFFQFF